MAVAERALARAACELGEVSDAIVHVRRALAAAARCGVADRVVEIQTTAANVWLLQGDHAKAFAALAAADEAAGGVTDPRTEAQRAVVLWRTGQLDAAIALSQALVRRADLDAKLRADTLVNLGCMWGEQGRFVPAGAALAEAVELFDQLGLALAAADATYNLSHLRTLEGHLPEALRLLDDVEERLVAAGASTLWVVLGRTHLLLQANLVEEAVQVCEAVAADRTVPLHVRAEATWRLALALLRAGDLARATKEASAAARLFQRVGDAPRAAIATRVEVQARAAAGRATPRLLDRASAGREVLAASGLASDALDAQVDVIQLAAALGRSGRVADELVAIRLARRRGPALVRARAWYGEALALRALGDQGRAERALQRGLRLLDDHRATFGSTELRAQASGHGAEMADLGLRLALERGRPATVLQWAERWRAGVVWRRPVVSDELATELAALRAVRAEREAAASSGDDVASLLRREEQLELTVRRLSRRTSGQTGGVRVGDVGAKDVGVRALDLARLHAALGPRALVEIVEQEGRLHAVVAAAGRCTLHHLGDAGRVTDELAALGFALRRLGRPRGSPAVVEAGRRSADEALARLDEQLLAPLRARLAARDLVVVPTAPLHAVPWPSLPSLAAAAVEVAPSSAWWCQRPAPSGAGETALVAGPGLPGAASEVSELASRYPGARVLTGAAATVEATTRALDGAALAHLACHGRFRAENPLFSALELADGSLTVYDLERLTQAPAVVVLSACDSGVSAVRPGDELLGLLSSLFALGTDAVVASAVPVPDLDTSALMLAFHDALGRGATAAAALGAARDAVDPTSPTGFVARTAFVCFGRS